MRQSLKERAMSYKSTAFSKVVHTLCHELLSFIVLCIALLYISASRDDASCTNTVKRIEKYVASCLITKAT